MLTSWLERFSLSLALPHTRSHTHNRDAIKLFKWLSTWLKKRQFPWKTRKDCSFWCVQKLVIDLINWALHQRLKSFFLPTKTRFWKRQRKKSSCLFRPLSCKIRFTCHIPLSSFQSARFFSNTVEREKILSWHRQRINLWNFSAASIHLFRPDDDTNIASKRITIIRNAQRITAKLALYAINVITSLYSRLSHGNKLTINIKRTTKKKQKFIFKWAKEAEKNASYKTALHYIYFSFSLSFFSLSFDFSIQFEQLIVCVSVNVAPLFEQRPASVKRKKNAFEMKRHMRNNTTERKTK